MIAEKFLVHFQEVGISTKSQNFRVGMSGKRLRLRIFSSVAMQPQTDKILGTKNSWIFAKSLSQDAKNMTYLLNAREKEQIKLLDEAYMNLKRKACDTPSQDTNLIYFLGDNAQNRRTWSACSLRIPTYRTNAGKYWCRHSKRWMTAVDKLASLGWPVHAQVAEAMTTPILPVLDPLRADKVAGNSMHLTQCAVILFLGLVCFGRGVESDGETPIDWTLARSAKRQKTTEL